jgi:hypothetical protein
MQSTRYSCQILMKLEFSRHIIEKTIVKLKNVRPVGAAVFHGEGQTRHNAANNRFSQFCKARKKETFGLLFRVVTPSSHADGGIRCL